MADRSGGRATAADDDPAAPTPRRKISLLVSDVDGTLVTDEKILTPRTQAAVRAVDRAGLRFAIMSSRPPRGLRMLIDALSIKTPVTGFNGGVMATPDLSPIEQHLLAPDVARQALDRIAACGAEAWVFSGSDWLLRDLTGPYVELERHTVQFAPTVVSDFGPALDRAAKIVGVSPDFDRLARCELELRAALAGRATVARSQPYYLDVTHPEANKGHALLALSRYLAIPPTEIAAIGDGWNDVAMFERSGLSIAMGNASPEVQRAAQFVTASNREDGFALAVERYVLPASTSAA